MLTFALIDSFPDAGASLEFEMEINCFWQEGNHLHWRCRVMNGFVCYDFSGVVFAFFISHDYERSALELHETFRTVKIHLKQKTFWWSHIFIVHRDNSRKKSFAKAHAKTLNASRSAASLTTLALIIWGCFGWLSNPPSSSSLARKQFRYPINGIICSKKSFYEVVGVTSCATIFLFISATTSIESEI